MLTYATMMRAAGEHSTSSKKRKVGQVALLVLIWLERFAACLLVGVNTRERIASRRRPRMVRTLCTEVARQTTNVSENAPSPRTCNSCFEDTISIHSMEVQTSRLSSEDAKPYRRFSTALAALSRKSTRAHKNNLLVLPACITNKGQACL